MNPKISDVARKAGVSPMTVSRVINNSIHVSDDLRERVNSAITQLGYRPHAGAQSLAKRKTKTLGVAVPYHSHIFSVDFFLRLLDGIESTADEYGYDVLIYNSLRVFTSSNQTGFSRFYRSGLIDGLLIIAPRVKDIPEIRKMTSQGMPYIIVNGNWQGLNCIDSDNVAGAYMAVKHLIDLGHRKIAFLTGDLTTSNGAQRNEGYRKALIDNGITVEEELIEAGEFELVEGHEAMKRLMARRHDFTAIFCSNDFMAVVAMIECRHAGLKIPENIAVVGYDDNEWSKHQYPPLTSVRQPLSEMGRRAVQRILSGIDKKSIRPEIEIFPNQLMIRESSVRNK